MTVAFVSALLLFCISHFTQSQSQYMSPYSNPFFQNPYSSPSNSSNSYYGNGQNNGRFITPAPLNPNTKPNSPPVAIASGPTVKACLAWSWDFGDQTKGTGKVVYHIYNSPPSGFVYVNLTVTDNNNAKASTKFPVLVGTNVRPVASATVKAEGSTGNIPVGKATVFDASASYDEDGVIVSYLWNFGDGRFDQGRKVIHTYIAPAGRSPWSVNVTDNCGASFILTGVINVVANPDQAAGSETFPPIARASGPLHADVGQAVYFSSMNSFDVDGQIMSYEWDFGDFSEVALGQVVAHAYQAPGIYVVRLLVTDNVGATDITAIFIQIGYVLLLLLLFPIPYLPLPETLPAALESSASHLSAVRVTTPSSGLPTSSCVQSRLSFSTPAARARGLHCLSLSQRWINFWQPGTRPHGLSVCSLPDSIWKAWKSAQAADFAFWHSGTRLSKTISSDSCNLQQKLFRLSVPRADSACLARFQRIPASARNAAIARISTDDARLRGLRWSSEPVVGSESPEQLAKRLGVPVHPVFLALAVGGLLNGANLCYEGPRSGSARLDNYSSATSHSEFVTGELDKELQKGWLSSWAASLPLLHPRIAPLGVVAKDESDLRIIIDLTAGGSLATNTCTPKLFPEFVRWESLLDVAKAFRLIPIRPMDWHLSVLDASPGIFGAIWFSLRGASFVVATRLGASRSLGRAILICSEEEARVILSLFQFVANRYGFPLKFSKLEGPTFSMQFIGWLFDVSMELPFSTVSVPVGKKKRFAQSARLPLQSPSFEALEKFLGKAFNFASVFNGLRPAACRVNAFKHTLPSQRPARLRCKVACQCEARH
eukprot:g51964.t1